MKIVLNRSKREAHEGGLDGEITKMKLRRAYEIWPRMRKGHFWVTYRLGSRIKIEIIEDIHHLEDRRTSKISLSGLNLMDLRDQDLAKIKTLTNLEAEMDPHETILMTVLEIRPLEVVEVGEAVEAHVEEEISVKEVDLPHGHATTKMDRLTVDLQDLLTGINKIGISYLGEAAEVVEAAEAEVEEVLTILEVVEEVSEVLEEIDLEVLLLNVKGHEKDLENEIRGRLNL